MHTFIQIDERGLLFKHGNYIKTLKSGKYFVSKFFGQDLFKMDMNQPFIPPKNLNLFLNDETLTKELSIIEVKDSEICIHYEDSLLTDVLKPGKYAYWNTLKKHTFQIIDTKNPIPSEDIHPSLFATGKINEFIVSHQIENHEVGVLYFNGKYQSILKPGKYYFWLGVVNVSIIKIDMRQQQLDLAGQELMTEDKITLRLNFTCQYKIKDPLKVLDIKNYSDQIYIYLQLILREYVGSLKLDELLQKKQEIGEFVLSRFKEKSENFGVEFLFAGLKDVILPGEIKDILNLVLIAEKKAQANIITRREETASTRSLMNTAKMMEDNPTLYRLKELEYIEKIAEKINAITLSSSSGILDQLSGIMNGKK